MRDLVLGVFFCLCSLAQAGEDDALLLARAHEMAENGRGVVVGETETSGAYCLVVVRLDASSSLGEAEREGKAVLEAKRRLTAYIQGENFSASRTLEESSSSISSGGRESQRKFSKRIDAKSEAFLRGLRPLGRVTAAGREFLAYVSTEAEKDASETLAKAQADNGGPNVVCASGEGETLEEALRNAKRLAVEQVLGSIVIGNERSETGKGFTSKSLSATDGRVEEYQIITQNQISGGVRVKITAKVSKENPFDKIVFYVEAPHETVRKRVSELISESGIRVTDNPDEAVFIVRCALDLEDFPHPATGRTCTRATPSVRIQSLKTGEEFLNLVSDESIVSKHKTVARRLEDCASRAVKAIEEPLWQKFQDAVARITRRVLNGK